MTGKIVLSVALALAVTSCASQPGPAGAPDSTSVETSATPVRFGLSRDEERTLHAAEQEYIRRCAAEAGFEFISTAYEELERLKSAAAETDLPPFGSDDVEAAAENGYGFSERLAEVPNSDPEATNRAIYESLSPEEQLRYDMTISGDTDNEVEVELPNGGVVSTPRDGCISDVRRLLYGDLERYIELVSIAINVEGRIRAEAASDPEFIAAEAGWAACMRDSGWDVSSQADAIALAAAAYETQDDAAARRKEIEVATDDATCAAETGSVAAAQRALAAARTKVAGDLEGELLAHQEMRLDALEAAREILAGQ